MSLDQQIRDATRLISSRWPRVPKIGIVLGSGLGAVAESLSSETSIAYREIPHFVTTTIEGHRGELICGQLGGHPIVAMSGRFHKYEGYSWRQITFPVQVLCGLGIELLIVSNAAGGLNPAFAAGDVMMIDSHLDLLFSRQPRRLACRTSGRCDRSIVNPYDEQLTETALSIARQEDFVLHRGAYISFTGPNYETRAEYRMLRKIGGDAVGMSTVPEVCVAAEKGVRVVGISTIANVARPDAPTETTHAQVVATTKSAEEKLKKIVFGIVNAAF